MQLRTGVTFANEFIVHFLSIKKFHGVCSYFQIYSLFFVIFFELYDELTSLYGIVYICKKITQANLKHFNLMNETLNNTLKSETL